MFNRWIDRAFMAAFCTLSGLWLLATLAQLLIAIGGQ